MMSSGIRVPVVVPAYNSASTGSIPEIIDDGINTTARRQRTGKRDLAPPSESGSGKEAGPKRAQQNAQRFAVNNNISRFVEVLTALHKR